ncbi:MAG: hypothetical protein ABEJ08_02060 [Halobacteriaceae archaeon]
MPEHATPPRAADQPTRGADRNRDLADTRGAGADLLPTLDPGLTLLDVEGDRGVRVVQSLVLDHLLRRPGPAVWVDAEGHATTPSLARLAPGRRLLDRIHVARGFTACKHYAALRDLPDAVARFRRDATRDDTDADGGAATPSLLVAPALDARYRDDDALRGEQAAVLQARALARLVADARRYDAPALVTRTAADAFAAPIEAAADHRLRCEQTREGPRFVGDEFETLVYPVGDGAYDQTTFAYWRAVLGARAEQVGRRPTGSPTGDGPGTASEGGVAGSDGDRGVATAGPGAGATTADAPRPLLDAWTGGGR